MIKELHYRDEDLIDSSLLIIPEEEKLRAFVIKGNGGVSYALQQIQSVINSKEPLIVKTNSPSIMDYVIERTALNWDNVYVYSYKQGKYINARKLTTKELLSSDIFSQLFINGEFPTTFKYTF